MTTGDDIINGQLKDLEDRLGQMYGQAAKETRDELHRHFAQYAAEDDKKRQQVKSGDLSEKDYKTWRQNNIYKTQATSAKLADISTKLTHVDEQAMQMVNGQLPSIYATGYNYEGYKDSMMAKAAGIDYTQFTIVNQDAVRELAMNDPDLIPWKPKTDIPEDQRWNRKHVQNAVEQGILQGDSMDKIANRLLPVVNMDKNAAIRTARTAVNGVENKGHLDATERVKEAGIPMIEVWSCTHDSRTRDSHALMDGEERGENGLFSNGLAYPGDPAGEPEEVYNCRCRLNSFIKGIDHSNDDALYQQLMEAEHYEDWLQVKEETEAKEEAFTGVKERAEEKIATSGLDKFEKYRQEGNWGEGYYIPKDEAKEMGIDAKDMLVVDFNKQKYEEEDYSVFWSMSKQDRDLYNEKFKELTEQKNGLDYETKNKMAMEETIKERYSGMVMKNNPNGEDVYIIFDTNKLEDSTKEPEPAEPINMTYAGHKDDGIDYRSGSRLSDEGIDAVSDELGVSRDEAKDMGKAIIDYSGSWYDDIRRCAQGDEDYIQFKDKVDNIEKFINRSPKWGEGKIYRGIDVDEQTAKDIVSMAKNGEPITMRGMSSWSSDKETAKEFSESEGNGASIIFVNKDDHTDYGTSIRHLSRYQDEDEILVSKDTHFEADSVRRRDGYIYIYGRIEKN